MINLIINGEKIGENIFDIHIYGVKYIHTIFNINHIHWCIYSNIYTSRYFSKFDNFWQQGENRFITTLGNYL